ncbi:MAG: hypothetical protein JSU81_00725 [Candidatus Coatesbacteria bacterium]|nr:MAG: hypothetical protein JSU81_00725 [Candidatus Coatesbacteria bacterium]
MDTIWFRVEGGATIGLGHVGRILALAQEARRGGLACRFALGGDAAARAFVASRGFDDVDAVPETMEEEVRFLVAAVGEAPLLTDLRGKDPAFYRRLREAGVRVCALDDMGEPLVAEIVVNGDIAPSFAQYEELWPPQRFLLGTKYIPLPPGYEEEPPAADDAARDRLLITFGGSDTADFTRRALEALAAVDPLPVDLVLGPAYPFGAEARAAAAESPHAIDLHAPASDMLPLYRRARLALAAGGITQFELLSQGVPTISVPHVAREEAESEAFAQAGAAVTYPERELRTGGAVVAAVRELWEEEERRRALAAAGRSLIDGRGAARILEAVAELVG